ncbi:MAG: 4-hydroxy-tetrahydrodipicolinate reductase [Halanaerobium sp.]|nr:4-hydroxy-tetrahydrodipicolinate reductase [Halanaerobium sp.]
MREIVVVGAAGRMGQAVIRAVEETDDILVTGTVDARELGSDPIKMATGRESNLRIEGDLEEVLHEKEPDLIVDFTTPQVIAQNIRVGLKEGVNMVIGTTGITADERAWIDREAKDKGISIFIAPNFALGAVLMMEFASKAARYLPNVEIIELHHDQKIDAPSGTSLLTAEKIGQARDEVEPQQSVEVIAGSRGGNAGGIPIHSVRLPGLVAHQEVIFGGQGQTLTIRHDSLDRSSFMPGVLLAIKKVGNWEGLVWGLEKIMD